MWRGAFILLLMVALLPGATAQRHKTPPPKASTPPGFFQNILTQAINSVKKEQNNIENGYQRGRAEAPYRKYQGKYIRHIRIATFNFDRSFTDTTVKDNGTLARVGKRLHYVTREDVVHNNLFIKEGSVVNPYKIADNERYLRTLDYLQDARFIMKAVKGSPDSVDLFVYTKDLFSIAGGASSDGLNHIKTNVYETNVAGMAQRVELSSLYDYNRTPVWGVGALYRKNNLCGTFIDATAAANTADINPYTGREETAEYIALERRLISPYTQFAGAMSFGNYHTFNIYHLSDQDYYNYHYQGFDAWTGYNIALNKLTNGNPNVRDRRFIAIRYNNKIFEHIPQQVAGRFDPFYNNTRYLLGQFTFFRQDYFKTQYVYGFGTTEDLPYGYNLAISGGWHQQAGLERPYAGLKATYFIATAYGDFIKLYLKTGGFLYQGEVQDRGLLLGATAYSRLMFINSTKVRQFVNVSFTSLHNRITTEPLYINNNYGLRGFLADSVYGRMRLSLQLETEFYIKPRLFGFKFAPFPYADFSLITPEHAPLSKTLLYSSIGGGVRARNESLVFETIEARAYYFPIAPTDMKGFKVIVTTNVRFRYPSNYVTAPNIISLNREQ
ncbi:MAG: hypothetical protein EBZ77_04415 [Chitinophagia bacterium]|nr:hypothetical protein [Chitinophagia bacterium]